ncbi:methyl-accepting chemotaxis protein [Pararhodospirillum photometricum]|uniref:PAS n=1 Tax=Pararhodospirillum photometricum DSM 122 TaxID=1150469 RepID=H6SNE7_PARPM|nr:methyl-accepting chemotaxis protein [Pararhodospirillum photometricum]CCG09278.1 PAS [Pararhodospirillum photometricum DSM 122]
MREYDVLASRLRALKARMAYFVLERAELAQRSENKLRQEMLALTELLEGEVQETVGDISAQSDRLREGAVQLSDVAGELLAKAREVAESVRITSGNVQTVAGATEQLEASSRAISEQVDQSSKLAEAARTRGDDAAHRVEGLSDATAQIGSVVNLIQGIAGQTRMLALNATIEAARAGDAGRGFAVVAGEVKGLADQTERAIGTISEQAATIGNTTRGAVETVQGVVETIRDIDAIAADVAHAATEQRAATAEIMTSAVQAAQHTQAVADSVGTMMAGAEMTRAVATRVNDLSGMVNRDIDALRTRLYVILRTSYGGNRRQEARLPVAVKVRGTFGGLTISGVSADLSTGGLLLVLSDDRAPQGTGTIEIEGVGRVAAEVVNVSDLGVNLRFTEGSAQQQAALQERIDAEQLKDKPLMAMAEEVAREASRLLESAVHDRRISVDDLFDATYTPIPGTDPTQFTARHTALAEQILGPVIVRSKNLGQGVEGAVFTDRNGYVAVHAPEYAQPQRPGDSKWNKANSRNRRIYDDRSGILAARCLKPLVQTYHRDMGEKNFTLYKEIDAPVFVLGRRWGAVRLVSHL